jgi:GTP1/Obg family GTP-binding protein
MNIKKSLLTSLTAGSILLSSTTLAFAQSPTTAPWQERAQERQEARQERIENRVERRCDIVNNRIDARISRYEDHYEDVEARMTRVTERMNEFVNRLESKGYDVAKVRSDLATLKEMRTTRRSLYTSFINKLEETKQYDCGDSEGAFKNALGESRNALAEWWNQIKSNRDFIRNTLKPDLQALRGQNPSPAPTE